MNVQNFTQNLTEKTFVDFGFSQRTQTVLDRLSLIKPTAIQSESLPLSLTGEDLIAVAQTGSGKTLAYVLAVLTHLEKDNTSRALILTPTRETGEQIHRVVSEFTNESTISTSLVVSGVTDAILTSQLKKNPRLIIATPGRLEVFLRQNKLLLKGLKILVIDEADRMLELGFEPKLSFIQSTLRDSYQTLLYAASFGAWAEQMAKKFLRAEYKIVRSDNAEKAVDTLSQKIYFLKETQKSFRLLDELKKIKESAIIFVESQDECVKLGRLLGHHGFKSEFMHGDMNPGHRNRVLREFREQKISILVTTDLLARGLDIPHLNYVISYSLPYKGEDFLHRIGRTARAGRTGHAITFVTPSDERTFRKIKKYVQAAQEEYLSTDFKFEVR